MASKRCFSDIVSNKLLSLVSESVDDVLNTILSMYYSLYNLGLLRWEALSSHPVNWVFSRKKLSTDTLKPFHVCFSRETTFVVFGTHTLCKTFSLFQDLNR